MDAGLGQALCSEQDALAVTQDLEPGNAGEEGEIGHRDFEAELGEGVTDAIATVFGPKGLKRAIVVNADQQNAGIPAELVGNAEGVDLC